MGAQTQADLLEAGRSAPSAGSRKRVLLVSAIGKIIMCCLVDFWNQQLEGLQPAQAQVERFQRLQRVALAHLDAGALSRDVGDVADLGGAPAHAAAGEEGGGHPTEDANQDTPMPGAPFRQMQANGDMPIHEEHEKNESSQRSIAQTGTR